MDVGLHREATARLPRMQRDRRDRNRGRGDTGVDAPDSARRPPPRAGVSAIAINRRAPYRRSFRDHAPAADLDLPRFSGHPAYPDLIQGGGAYGPEACPAAV